jgi:hypothetical protein
MFDAPGSHVGADEEADVAVLEQLQVAAALVRGSSAVEHNARVRVLLTLLGGSAELPPATDGHEVLLQVVAVQLGAGKH